MALEIIARPKLSRCVLLGIVPLICSSGPSHAWRSSGEPILHPYWKTSVRERSGSIADRGYSFAVRCPIFSPLSEWHDAIKFAVEGPSRLKRIAFENCEAARRCSPCMFHEQNPKFAKMSNKETYELARQERAELLSTAVLQRVPKDGLCRRRKVRPKTTEMY
jgi:hypothetical protein